MQIGELAEATGLSRDALRFYERRGLLTSERQANGYRWYPPQAVDWLRCIQAAQSLGFSLGEIEADLALLREPVHATALGEGVREALLRKRALIDARLADLTALRAALDERLAAPGAACPYQGDARAAPPRAAQPA